jgi:hypothetical protein
MYYGYDGYAPGGSISDYNLDNPIKAKSINFYVQDVPLLADEAAKQVALLLALPQGVPYGVRTRKWSEWYPDAPFDGEIVSYSTYNDLGQAVEHMIPYDDFNMVAVPWEDIIA